MLARCGADPAPVKNRESLANVEGLILPGGESTTLGKLLVRFDLLEPLKALAAAGLPMYGTCAGMILLADRIVDGLPGQPSLGVLHASVRRNAFGRQVESFEADVPVAVLGAAPFPAVFIRAPIVESVSNGVVPLAVLNDRIVAARQGSVLVTSFHPELTADTRMHRYFLGMIRERPRA